MTGKDREIISSLQAETAEKDSEVDIKSQPDNIQTTLQEFRAKFRQYEENFPTLGQSQLSLCTGNLLTVQQPIPIISPQPLPYPGIPAVQAPQVPIMFLLQEEVPVRLHPFGRRYTGILRNPKYDFMDIHSVNKWHNFDLNTIMTAYGDLLIGPQAATVAWCPRSNTPEQQFTSEPALHTLIHEPIRDPVRRALRSTWQSAAGIQMRAQIPNRYPPIANDRKAYIPGHDSSSTAYDCIGFHTGSMARSNEGSASDLSFCDPEMPGRAPNRVPGDIKPSWRWCSNMRYRRSRYRQYLQGLSHVNWYMKQHNARYGFILTDAELVAIRRLDDRGNLEVSDPVMWGATGRAGAPTLTIRLALWYLGMLGAKNTGDDRWDI
ncbi:hypothetical protein FQN57_000588 [Myotisia sp. PD_48]|nr:hypothetical protein FQN57_000588 [Myotisia sp. PD_48]